MAKDYLSQYDTTAGNNTDVGGVSVAEGTAPSNINDAIREVMSHLAGFKSQLEVGADVASASALPVDVAGMFHDVTGTTTITSFAATTNDTSKIKVLQFDAALTLTHHATDLILLTGANRTTAAGDIGVYYEYASGDWREVSYFVAGTTYLSDLVSDTSPQLGGDLDLNGNNIDFPTTANISDVLDEDDMSSDSATALATQQSIKAYVDNNTGGWSFVSSQTASNSATIDFTSLATGYDYMIVATNVQPATDSVIFQAQLGVAGITYRTSNYIGTIGQIVSSSSVSLDSTTYIPLSYTGSMGTGTDESGVFELILYDPAATADTYYKMSGAYRNSATNEAVVSGGGHHTVSEAHVAVRFLMSTGNVSTGVFRLYRRPNA